MFQNLQGCGDRGLIINSFPNITARLTVDRILLREYILLTVNSLIVNWYADIETMHWFFVLNPISDKYNKMPRSVAFSAQHCWVLMSGKSYLVNSIPRALCETEGAAENSEASLRYKSQTWKSAQDKKKKNYDGGPELKNVSGVPKSVTWGKTQAKDQTCLLCSSMKQRFPAMKCSLYQKYSLDVF